MKILPFAALIAVLSASGTTLAQDCQTEIARVNDALATATDLDAELRPYVIDSRDEAASLCASGSNEAAIEALHSAKFILYLLGTDTEGSTSEAG